VQQEVGDLRCVDATSDVDYLGVDPKPLMRRGFVVVLVQTDWFEAFWVDIEAEFSPECAEAVRIGWNF
jgi:hypothetical protein